LLEFKGASVLAPFVFFRSSNPHNRQHPSCLLFVAPERMELAVAHRAEIRYVDVIKRDAAAGNLVSIG